MQVRVSTDDNSFGKCGCGRSPTGKCIGWHGLSEELYQHQKMLWLEEQERKDNEIQQKAQDDKP